VVWLWVVCVGWGVVCVYAALAVTSTVFPFSNPSPPTHKYGPGTALDAAQKGDHNSIKELISHHSSSAEEPYSNNLAHGDEDCNESDK
jgi:hypothetical protein